jgi:hypothetical protein
MLQADKLTPILELNCLDYVGSSTSYNPVGLHSLLKG